MMHARPTARLLFAAIACAELVAPGVVRADPSSTAAAAPLDQSLQGPAREAYAYARTLFEHADFAGALAKYSQAYDLSKDPRLLFNMAICERNLHAYARMQQLLVRYKSESGSALSPADRGTVDAALAASQNLVGTLAIRVSEAGAAVTVDGEDVGATPIASPVVLDLGKHTVVVRKDGFESVERVVDVAGGAQATTEFTLTARGSTGAHLVVAADGDALVAVDHQEATRGRFDGSVAAGAHEVDVSAPGKRPYHVEVSLRAGETRSLDVTLEADKPGSPLWPWIVGGAAVAAGAVVGGYLIVKSQQGSPSGPSGGLATVQFQLGRAR